MSNEILLAIVGGLVTFLGVIFWRLWDSNADKIKEQKSYAEKIDDRLRKIETDGGEPVRRLGEQIDKLDDRLDELTSSIKELTHELHDARMSSFGRPTTNPGGA